MIFFSIIIFLLINPLHVNYTCSRCFLTNITLSDTGRLLGSKTKHTKYPDRIYNQHKFLTSIAN